MENEGFRLHFSEKIPCNLQTPMLYYKTVAVDVNRFIIRKKNLL